MSQFRVGTPLALALILAIALALRVHGIGFGLPSMYDPDEPFFVLKAYEMIDAGTLNPHWFGHPGTLTIYTVMVVEAGVAIAGFLFGQWSGIDQFASAVYANPGLIFLPARGAMVLFGIGCVWLTYVAGKRLFGAQTGLLAAALIALNGLHISWSQVIRTDIQSSLFMLACLLFAAKAADEGNARDFVLGGIMAGLAAATKWPSGSIAVALIGAAACQVHQRQPSKRAVRNLLLGGIASLATLFAVSPFLIIDWRTALNDVLNEGKAAHLGHTGDGPLANLLWYADTQVIGTMGWIGLIFMIIGLWAALRSPTSARWTLIPATLALLGLLAAQHLIWSRWILPLLPLLALLAGAGLSWLAEVIASKTDPRLGRWAWPALALCLLIPSAAGAWGAARERSDDTRDRAAAWAEQNIPPGSRVVVEHLQIGFRSQPWTVLFPLGEAGCIDGKEMLSRKVRFDDVQRDRKGSKIVDLGNVTAGRLDSCRADFAILSYYDLYLAERSRYPQQLAMYGQLLGNGHTLAVFRPKAGETGGPVIRIVAMRPIGRVK